MIVFEEICRMVDFVDHGRCFSADTFIAGQNESEKQIDVKVMSYKFISVGKTMDWI